MLFASGMAAVCAVLEPALGPGDVLVVVEDGYPGVRGVARDRLAPRGVEVRFVPTDTEAIVAACDGATLAWIETPSNPALDVADIAAVAGAVHAQGGRLAVDNTLATPLGQRPLDLGADAAMLSATKALSGHSDLVLGAVSVRDPDWAGRAARRTARRAARSRARSRPGCSTARSPRSPCGSSARARTRSRSRSGCASGQRCSTSATPASPTTRDHAIAVRQMQLVRPARRLHARRRRARAALPRGRSSWWRRRRASAASTRRRSGARAGAPTRWRTGFIRFSAGCEDLADLHADLAQALEEG